jgi:hypothetical protein
MQCIAVEHTPPGANPNTSTAVRGRAGVRHLRPAELAAVRQSAGAAFGLNRPGGHGGDLLSPEFSPLFTRPLPARRTLNPHSSSARAARADSLTRGRVIPLRPDLAGWTRPLTGGAPLRLVPGRGRHHHPEPPVHPTLEGYTHLAAAPVPAPRKQVARPRTRIRRSASRVRAYVSHPAGDLAPLALAVRSYLARGVR